MRLTKPPSSYETVKATYYKACPHYAREAEAEPEDGDALGKRQLLGFAGDLISKGCECLSLHPRTVYKTYYHTTVVSYNLPVFHATWRLKESADY